MKKDNCKILMRGQKGRTVSEGNAFPTDLKGPSSLAFAVQLRGNWKQGHSDPDTQRSMGLAGLVSLAILGVQYAEPR